MSAQEVKEGDRFERLVSGNFDHPEGCIRTVAVIESPSKFGHVRCLFNGIDGEAFASDLLSFLWKRLPRDDAPSPATAPPSVPAIPRHRWFSTIRIPLSEIDQAFSASASALLAHDFGDRYLTFVVRRADGSKTVHLLCRGCGATNVGAVMATACPGPRDWSADRKRGESAHAFNTDQIDARAKKEREERAELEKKQPRGPGPGLLHAGSLVGGPQFGAWRREGC